MYIPMEFPQITIRVEIRDPKTGELKEWFIVDYSNKDERFKIAQAANGAYPKGLALVTFPI